LYIVTQLIGAIINLLVFFLSIKVYPSLSNQPLLPLAFGASISFFFNFIVSNRYIFKG
jgi:putative flippase GtrA